MYVEWKYVIIITSLVIENGGGATVRSEAGKPKLHDRDNKTKHRAVDPEAEINNRHDLEFRSADDKEYDSKITVQIGSTEPVLQA